MLSSLAVTVTGHEQRVEMPQDRIRHLAGNTLLLATALVAGVLFAPRLFDLDDAYISAHSARVLLDGVDPVFGATALTGATNPPYVALLAVLMKAGASDIAALRVSAMLSLAALVVALWALGCAFQLSVWRRAAYTVIVLASGLTVVQATNGLETGFAMALAIALMAAVVANRPYSAAVSAGLLPALRPELAPIALALFAMTLWRTRWERRFLVAGALAVVVSAPWLLWMRLDTGAWAPGTIRAKSLFFAQSCLPLRQKTAYVAQGLMVFAATTAPASYGLIAAFRSRMGRLGLAAAFVVLAMFLIQLPTGVFTNEHRYLYPILIPLAAFGCGWWAKEASGRTGAVILILTAIWAVPLGWRRAPPRGYAGTELADVSNWINRHTDANAVLLVHDAGGISVFGRRRAVDMVGLKTPSSVSAHEQWTMPSCGAERSTAVAAIARQARADYVVAREDWDGSFNLIAGLRGQGFAVQVVRPAPENPYPYTVYRLFDEGNRSSSLFAR